jgi:transmembrane sensor
MPDGTVIWLNSSSELEVDFNDTARRVKLIKGEGHFQVAKMPSRPFEVYADDRLVKAIGTAFTVHKTRGNVEVLVTEGSVELALLDSTLVVMPDDYPATSIGQNIPSTAFKSAQSPEVKKVLGRLSAGQRASIQVDNDELTNVVDLDSSEVTRFLSWKEGKLVFAGESLEEVIREITRHTPIKIDVADPKLKSMRIGGQFKLGDTEALFYVLESGFGISVNKLDESHVELKVKEK